MGAVYSLAAYRKAKSVAYAANPRETVRIYLPSNPPDDPKRYWVAIKPKLDFGDAQYRLSQTMKIDMDMAAASEGADPEMRADYKAHAMNQATLERAIQAWNLTEPVIDAEGQVARDEFGTEREQPMELSAANILRLNDEDANAILEEIRQRNPVRNRKQKNV